MYQLWVLIWFFSTRSGKVLFHQHFPVLERLSIYFDVKLDSRCFPISRKIQPDTKPHFRSTFQSLSSSSNWPICSQDRLDSLEQLEHWVVSLPVPSAVVKWPLCLALEIFLFPFFSKCLFWQFWRQKPIWPDCRFKVMAIWNCCCLILTIAGGWTATYLTVVKRYQFVLREAPLINLTVLYITAIAKNIYNASDCNWISFSNNEM